MLLSASNIAMVTAQKLFHIFTIWYCLKWYVYYIYHMEVCKANLHNHYKSLGEHRSGIFMQVHQWCYIISYTYLSGRPPCYIMTVEFEKVQITKYLVISLLREVCLFMKVVLVCFLLLSFFFCSLSLFLLGAIFG